MKIEIELWHLISMLIAFIAFTGAFGKLLLSQIQKNLKDKFEAQEKSASAGNLILANRLDTIEKAGREEAKEWQRIEREVLMLKADLPQLYVRREDYIRGQSIIEAKLDGLAVKFENALLRSVQGSK